MIKKILALVIAAASCAALIGVLTWPGEAQQRMPATPSNILTTSAPPLFDQSYTAGMRIIQVPQAGAPPVRASARAIERDEADASEADVQSAPSPAPQRRRAAAPPSHQPRRVLAPPNAEKRTMLNAPKALHDGPSPVRPLPRWRGSEKFTELPRQVAPVPAPDAVVASPLAAAPIDSHAANASDMPAIDDDTPPPAD